MALQVVPTPGQWRTIASASFPGAATVTISDVEASRIAILIEGVSSSAGSSTLRLQFNGDTASNYYKFADTSANTSLVIAQIGTAASTFFMSYIVELADTTAPIKPLLNGGANGSGDSGGMWRNTSKITSITLRSGAGNFDAGTYTILGI